MGGLLDKANAAKDESVIEAEVLEPATIVEEVKADPPKNSGSSASMPDESSNENNSIEFR